MRNFLILIYSTIFLIHTEASAVVVEKIYLDRQNNVHVLKKSGKDTKITSDGKASDLTLSPDRQTIAWLTKENEKTNEGVELGPSKLIIYRNNEAKTIQCQPFIRGYWFWKNGSQFAIDCGGEHFAGREILYDTRSLKILETLDQDKVLLEKRPDWANGDN